jgi:nitrogen fixation/metabolism regulation signal transduction histidine kinase
LPKLELKKHDIGKVIKQVAKMFHLSYPDITFKYETVETALLRFDAEQMARVFINIFTNAVSALESSKLATIVVTTTKDHSYLIVKISDNGVGIPEEIQTRIIEPHFSTKSTGSGLGLAIVNQIIEEHGGQLAIASQQGLGSEITVKLPLTLGN